MEAVQELVGWAVAEGLELNGIEPQSLPGRGIGLVAARNLKADEVILEVPTKLLKGIRSVPRATVRRLPADMTVHGLLAADVCLDTSSAFARWRAVLPSRADVDASMPLTWDARLQACLPPPARRLLENQQAKFARDADAVLAAFPAVSRDGYLHAWLLVNSRTFYHVTPRTERLAPDDRMVLLPVADLLNHADAGCSVAFDAAGFAIRTDRAYARGDELCISYGRHTNDFLLVEYGFCLAANRWDEAALDDVVLPALRPPQAALLDELGFLGGYALDAETACFRTQVALRARSASRRELQRFVQGDEGGWTPERAEAELQPLLAKYAGQVAEVVSGIDLLDAGQECQRQTLRLRWMQILELINLHRK